MPELIYPDLSYNVQGALYDVYNELRHLELSEEGWESALLIALSERGVPAQRQVERELRYKGFDGYGYSSVTHTRQILICKSLTT